MCPTGSVQLAERAVYQMKQLASGAARTAAASSSWQLEEAQVFWAKGEQGPALGLLKEMINTLEGQVRETHTHMHTHSHTLPYAYTHA